MNRHIATTSAAAALLLSAFAGASAATADTTPNLSADMDKSIVWVDVTWDAEVTVPFTDGTTAKKLASIESLCTGWFVSTTGHIATAGHCVTMDDNKRLALIQDVIDDNGYDVKAAKMDWDMSVEDPMVKVGQPSGIPGGPFTHGEYLTAQLIATQKFLDGDNALLRVADLTGTPALEVAEGTPATGDAVISIGFPGSVMAIADVQRQRPSHKNGTVSSRQYSKRGVPSTEIDAAVSQGMSGGPTINADGKVIGVNSFGITGESQPFNFVTDTSTLRDFLSANGVHLEASTTSADAPTTPDSPNAGGTAKTEQTGGTSGGTNHNTPSSGNSTPTVPAAAKDSSDSTGFGGYALGALFGLAGAGGAAAVLRQRSMKSRPEAPASV